MKALHESKYAYKGIFNGSHVFLNVIQDDSEVVLIQQARYNKLDGTSIYFDPVSQDRSTLDINQFKRLFSYRKIAN